ncbi:hypothetical protein NL501_28800, partial [Klebsiella pneumoniae]|nr:hypothetical protein [Klebsiella pneumoniae]
HEYIKYTNNPNDYSVAGCKLNFADILNHCKDMKPQLIPYSSLTKIIFKYDLRSVFCLVIIQMKQLISATI